MTTATDARGAVTEYLDALKAELDDIPPDERQEVLDDLEAHLAEVAAESDEPLERRLGSPKAYAAELRASAGYGSAAPSRTDGRLTRLARSLAAQLPGLRAVLVEARPGWWLLRGPIAVAAATVFWQLDNFHDLRTPDPGPLLAIAVTALASMPLSVAIGRRAQAGRDRTMSVLANVVVGLAFLLAVGHLHDLRTDIVYVGTQSPDFLQAQDGRPIFNIYPFAADGTPLDGVLLYDQDGVPVENLADHTRSGVPVARQSTIRNLFPQTVLIGPEGEQRPDQRPVIAVPQAPAPSTTTTAPPPAA